ncbi:hypothetical protein KX928_05610 [Roseobacter sp. YSTF-M11]|uniref:Ryanodine receptor Ryr domain-containing protein n=1 Tax=Roseobacter insulae TaxID=2859783 RepID=A0A9X1FUS4_9RHOB|nr:hypothetical protein [Roseobacter insulae]MBW4707258.1 hypothetical protein [Roseobacter insulae]
MFDQKKISLTVLAGLFTITCVLGVVGWSTLCGGARQLAWSDILYRTALAFMADGIYVDDIFCDADREIADRRLVWARSTGILTTISAVIGVVMVFLGDQVKRVLSSQRRGSQIIFGASDFAVDYAARHGRAVVFDTKETFETLTQRDAPFGTLWIPDRLDKHTVTRRSFGRTPSRIIFGDRDSILNVERAQLWMDHTPPEARQRTELVLRIEDNAVARDLALLSDRFARAKLISRGEIIARSLVTAMAPTCLARLRNQPQAHIALVGLGSTNLAIAEELVLRCHHPDLAPLCLSIVDRNIPAAQARLRAERPDLLNPEFARSGPFIRWIDMDGLQACAVNHSETLCAAERDMPLTAIVVAAGQDTQNSGIAMRLRQLQQEKLILRAPIYMRNDSQSSIAPKPLRDLSGGIVPFGGRILDAEDIQLEAIYQELAKSVHDTWRNAKDVEKTPQNSWEALTTQQQRASYRAALSSVEMFYAGGFVPPYDTAVSGLRVHPTAGQIILSDDAVMSRLMRAEHDRWCAERRAEGFRSHSGQPRDDEKKLHPLIVPNEDLPPGQPLKDRRNVQAAVALGIKRFEADTSAPCWRPLLRVGVIGPLATDAATLDRLEQDFTAFWKSSPLVALDDRTLEIMTPNAPGFDRQAAMRLMQVWERLSGRKARVLACNVAGRDLVDRIAAEYLSTRLDGTALKDLPLAKRRDLLAGLAGQYDALAAGSQGRLRHLDMRPLGVSDADLDADRDLYFETTQAVQKAIMQQADMMIIDTSHGKSTWSMQALDVWTRQDKPCLRLS